MPSEFPMDWRKSQSLNLTPHTAPTKAQLIDSFLVFEKLGHSVSLYTWFLLCSFFLSFDPTPSHSMNLSSLFAYIIPICETRTLFPPIIDVAFQNFKFSHPLPIRPFSTRFLALDFFWIGIKDINNSLSNSLNFSTFIRIPANPFPHEATIEEMLGDLPIPWLKSF